jgi:hypothetical protein
MKFFFPYYPVLYLFVRCHLAEKKLSRNFCRVADLDSDPDPVEGPDP